MCAPLNLAVPVMSAALFKEKLANWLSTQTTNSSHFVNDADHHLMIKKLLAFSTANEKPSNSREFRWVASLTLVEYGDTYKLVRKNGGKQVVPESRLFEVIHDAHVLSGHGGRDKLVAVLKKEFWNVTYEFVQIYLSTCQQCEEKRPRARRHLVVSPIVSDGFNSRAQADLINFESEPDGEYKYVLTYQDHLTKFVFLKALTSK